MADNIKTRLKLPMMHTSRPIISLPWEMRSRRRDWWPLRWISRPLNLSVDLHRDRGVLDK
jgi:hypothetical protein